MSIIGKWNLTINSPMGQQTSVLELNADGTGVTSSQLGSAQITGAKIDGNSASYNITIDAMGQKMELACTAKADGDKLTGDISTPMGGAPFTGTRA